ncbi:MAG TPA: hypothetical protein VLE21_01860 [Candidatus Nitrosocosmicus sp.]|nr:hypothetical protein [Candidatus Nitrosocosmicus sp.]
MRDSRLENKLSYSVSKSTTLLPIDEKHKAYVNFISSLKSPITRKAYVIRLKNYLRSPIIQFSTFDELLSRDRHSIEQGIIDILIEMQYYLVHRNMRPKRKRNMVNVNPQIRRIIAI